MTRRARPVTATPSSEPRPEAAAIHAKRFGAMFRSSPLCGSLDADAVLRLVGSWDFHSFADGDPVVREGDSSRDLWFLLEGRAEILRNGLSVATCGPGDFFGELALVSGAPRSATVRAVGGGLAARLTRAAFEELLERQPMIAQRLLQGMVRSLGVRLTELTDSVGILLHERSLPRRTSVAVESEGRTSTVKVGTRLRDLLPRRVGEHLVVAATMGRKAVSLHLPVSADCRVEPLTSADWEGLRILQSSVDLLFLEAAHRVDPSFRLHLGDTAGPGRRIRIDPSQVWRDGEVFGRIEDTMRSLVAADAPLLEELWMVEEAEDHFRRLGSPAAELLRTRRNATVPLVSYGSYYALQTSPMLPSTGDLAGARVVADQHGWLLVYREEQVLPALQIAGWQGAAMPHAQETWLRALGIRSVGEFNQACIAGNVPELIRVVEGFQEKQVGKIADEISHRSRDIKVICVAGPSSSGKTTFIKRLRIQLQVNGLNPIGLSMDDYYVDRDRTPRDTEGGYDFESIEALQLDLLDGHLRTLMEGREVTTARFDFQVGRSHPEGGPRLTLGARDMLMMEGIHGLNPRIVANLDPASVYRIFICPRAQLAYDHCSRVHASDVRLLRRIVRDRHSRGLNAAQTIDRWPSVRAGERRHIFPFQQYADTVFDSSLIYELSVLKVYAERYLFEVRKDHPAFQTAFRLLRLLDDFVAIYPDHVPPTSFLREFIGGSGFEY